MSGHPTCDGLVAGVTVCAGARITELAVNDDG
jgi:hypothetical protein